MYSEAELEKICEAMVACPDHHRVLNSRSLATLANSLFISF